MRSGPGRSSSCWVLSHSGSSQGTQSTFIDVLVVAQTQEADGAHGDEKHPGNAGCDTHTMASSGDHPQRACRQKSPRSRILERAERKSWDGTGRRSTRRRRRSGCATPWDPDLDVGAQLPSTGTAHRRPFVIAMTEKSIEVTAAVRFTSSMAFLHESVDGRRGHQPVPAAVMERASSLRAQSSRRWLIAVDIDQRPLGSPRNRFAEIRIAVFVSLARTGRAIEAR